MINDSNDINVITHVFVSVPKVCRFGSVCFGNSFFLFDAVRPAFFGRVMARSGSFRFGSASGSGRLQS